MPELPEVETVVRGLRPDLIGKTITSFWYDWLPAIRTPSPEQFEARVVGQRVEAIERRAKYVVIVLEDTLLMVHLKMSGRLYVTPADAQHDADRWVHVRFGLSTGEELRFSDARKFGRVYLTNAVEQVTGPLGPEPLEDAFSLAVFQSRLAGRSRLLKALLLDQTFIAGVGNIYADEALYRSRLHPLRRSDTLTDEEVALLYDCVRSALRDGIRHEGATLSWYRKPDGSKGSSQEHFDAYGRTDLPCHRCGTPISKIRVAQRGTHFCPTCQRLPSDTG